MGNAKALQYCSRDEDSHPSENLQYLSDVIVTADDSLVRFHGRNTKGHYWYNYLYSEQELKPWVEKVDEIEKQTKILRIYFKNHYGGKAVANALQFKALAGHPLSEIERRREIFVESSVNHIFFSLSIVNISLSLAFVRPLSMAMLYKYKGS